MSDIKNLRERCEDQLRSTSCYNRAMIEELAGYMVEQIQEEVKAELEGARDTFDRAAFLTEIHAKSFRNGPTSPHFVDVADVYRALEHHAVSAPAVAQAAEFHAIGNPPPEVMALVQEEYKRMAEAKDRTSAQPSGDGAK